MCIGMCIGEKRKTREMAFGVALLWFVLLPSPLQKYPNVFIPKHFSRPYVMALVILLQRSDTADGATW